MLCGVGEKWELYIYVWGYAVDLQSSLLGLVGVLDSSYVRGDREPPLTLY